jgi:hypothetical protein
MVGIIATIFLVIGISYYFASQPKVQTFPEPTRPIDKDYNILLNNISWNAHWVNVTWIVNENTKPLWWVESGVNNSGTITIYRMLVQKPVDGTYCLFNGDMIRIPIHNTSNQPFSSNMTITQICNFDGEYQLLNFTTT